MKHLVVNSEGVFLGLNGERLICKKDGNILSEIPLRKLKTVQVLKGGVSFSSNLIYSFAERGIQLFFNDFRQRTLASLCGIHQHAVVQNRKKQFTFIDTPLSSTSLSQVLIKSKIRNQRAV